MQLPENIPWSWRDLESFFEYLESHGSRYFRAEFTRLANGEPESQGYGYLDSIMYRVRALRLRDLKDLIRDSEVNGGLRVKMITWQSEDDSSVVHLNLPEKSLSITTGSISLIELLRHKLSRTPPLNTSVDLLTNHTTY